MKKFATILALVGAASMANAANLEVSSNITADTRWTNADVYILTDVIYVLPPAVLTIEPGTIIKGVNTELSTGTDPDGTGPQKKPPGALVISRGAKVAAYGTVSNPIIMTALGDTNVPGGTATIPATVAGNPTTEHKYNFTPTGPELDDTDDLGADATTDPGNVFGHAGLWGGFVMLGRTFTGFDGNANGSVYQGVGADPRAEPTTGSSTENEGDGPLNNNGVGFSLIEGLRLSTLTLGSSQDFDGDGTLDGTSFRPGVYGGIKNDDNSGIARFISIRHAGNVIGAGNELNGLTMGALGSPTIVEFIEVWLNKDDGLESFAGYNNHRWVGILFQGDDGVDGDQGYGGTYQNSFVLVDSVGYFRQGYDINGNGTLGWDMNNDGTVDAGGDAADFVFAGGSPDDDGNNGIEMDGFEPFNITPSIGLPNTNGFVRNLTVVSSNNIGGRKDGSEFNSDEADTGHDGMLLRRRTDINVRNVVFEQLNDIFNNTNVNTAEVQGARWFSRTGADINGTAGGTASVNYSALGASDLRSGRHLTRFGLDPRAKPGAAGVIRNLSVGSDPVLTMGGFISPVNYIGGMRDNNWLRGWTLAEKIELFGNGASPVPGPGTNVDRPNVSVSFSSGNPVISFNADINEAGDNSSPLQKVLYEVQRSDDGGKTYNVVALLQDGENNVYGFATNDDAEAAVGTIKWTDSIVPGIGADVRYRVIAH